MKEEVLASPRLPVELLAADACIWKSVCQA